MNLEELWAQVEIMFLNSNSMHTRRIQALDTKMIKGETVSAYFIRMKLAFNEADMGKASIVTIMLSLLIANLPSDGAEGKIKQELPTHRRTTLTFSPTRYKRWSPWIWLSSTRGTRGETV